MDAVPSCQFTIYFFLSLATVLLYSLLCARCTRQCTWCEWTFCFLSPYRMANTLLFPLWRHPHSITSLFPTQSSVSLNITAALHLSIHPCLADINFPFMATPKKTRSTILALPLGGLANGRSGLRRATCIRGWHSGNPTVIQKEWLACGTSRSEEQL